jgi:formylglycine-generating enzyme required for sulfatase activity
MTIPTFSTLPIFLLRVIAIAGTCIFVANAQGVPPYSGRTLAVASNQNRVALVIGNAAYKQGALVNPVNDARAMAKRLRSLGFDVVLRENLKARDIGSVYREFRSKVTPGGVALVFYAGHGIQFKGQNYFPAVDADIHSEEDVPLQSLNLGNMLDNMEEAKAGVSLVFLDACRDNPFARRFRSNTRGLAKVETASGMLIHYATRPGSVASDGDGQNGTYTEALLAQMSEPGVPVEQMLKRVANHVVAKTKGSQEPWVEGSLRGDFYFVLQKPAAAHVQALSADPEAEIWAATESANTVEGYQAYLDSYPRGRHELAAQIRLAQMKKQGTDLHPDTVLKDCAECPDIVVIPAGHFDMGALGKTHRVTIVKFALGKTEVTQGLWKAVMGSNPSHFSTCGDDCPVEQVSWDDAQEFIKNLNAKTSGSYRLPSEAEWEYACRAGGRHEYCGSESLDSIGWYGAETPNGGNSGKTTNPVARKEPNAWGLYDMSGNVYEWTQDCWNDNYIRAPINGSAWITGDCERRVLRGGAWYSNQKAALSHFRFADYSSSRYNSRGFRLAKEIQ